MDTTCGIDFGNTGHSLSFVDDAIIDTTSKWGSGSLAFDAANDNIQIADSADWDICASSSSNWTIDFWVKHTDHVDDEKYIAQREGAGNYWYINHTHGAGLRFYLLGDVTIDTGQAGEITDTDWHHVAMCKVGEEYGVYLDGTQVSHTSTADTDTFAGTLYLGQSGGGGDWFTGNLDDVRIINSKPVRCRTCSGAFGHNYGTDRCPHF